MNVDESNRAFALRGLLSDTACCMLPGGPIAQAHYYYSIRHYLVLLAQMVALTGLSG